MWNNEERTIAYKKARALERIADNLEKVVELLTELKNGGKDEKKGFDLSPFKADPLRKLIIFSEYNYLTTKWIDQQGITAKIVVVNGANEGLLLNDLCDLIVCVVLTGETLRANGLVILDTIYESKIGLYVKKGIENEIQQLINKAKI